MLVHGDYEIMKHFKKTCEEKLDVLVVTPGNYDRVKFKEDPLYYQIDISEDVFNIVKCLYKMESVKSRKTAKVVAKALKLRENLIDITKVDLFNKGGRNEKIKNKVNLKVED